MELARASRAEPRKQSLLRDCVLHEVDVSIEVEPDGTGTDLPHCNDGGQISFLAAPDQGHGCAATRRFRHIELNVRGRDHVEAD
jgi:hypothetical protein